jgi:hypothetical protein
MCARAKEVVMPVHMKTEELLDERRAEPAAGEREMTAHEPEFANDLLRGAEEIAGYLYGNREVRRKVYHLVATSNLPVFKLGSTICARKSVLLEWVKAQEERHARQKRGGRMGKTEGGGGACVGEVKESCSLIRPSDSQSCR